MFVIKQARLHAETDAMLQLFAQRHYFRTHARAPPPSKAVEEVARSHNVVDALVKTKVAEGRNKKMAVSSSAMDRFVRSHTEPFAHLEFLNTLHAMKDHAHAPEATENLKAFTRRATAPTSNIERFAMIHVQRQHAHCPDASHDLEAWADSHVFKQASTNPARKSAAAQFCEKHSQKNANLNLFTQLHAMREHARAPAASEAVMDFVEKHNDPHGLLDHITQMHFFTMHASAPPPSAALQAFAQKHATGRTHQLIKMQTMRMAARAHQKTAPKPTNKHVKQFRRHSTPNAPSVNTNPSSPRLSEVKKRQSVGASHFMFDKDKFDAAGNRKGAPNGTGAPAKHASSSKHAPPPTHKVKGKTRSGSPWPGQHNRAPAPPANSRTSSPAQSIGSKVSGQPAASAAQQRAGVAVHHSGSQRSIR